MNLVFASGVLFPQKVGPLEYFRGLPDEYPDALFPNVKGIDSVEQRAKQLAEEIDQKKFPSGPIHIIAHSMGGLDARRFLVEGPKSLTERVVSLSTIATPHHGSLIADLLAGELEGSLITDLLAGRFDGLARIVSWPLRRVIEAFPGLRKNALDDLTTNF